MHAPIAEAHGPAWSSSCSCTFTGCAQDDGAEAVAKQFQQFLDANGKTLQQQGAADADLNAVLDYFATSRASASRHDDATAMADACKTGASQAIAWHNVFLHSVMLMSMTSVIVEHMITLRHCAAASDSASGSVIEVSDAEDSGDDASGCITDEPSDDEGDC
jgi:hypothetical protein